MSMSTLVDLVDKIEKKKQKVYRTSAPNCFPSHLHNYITYKNIVQSQQTVTTPLLTINRATTIILDIANYRLLRPGRTDVPMEKPNNFVEIKFLNKAVDGISFTSTDISH